MLEQAKVILGSIAGNNACSPNGSFLQRVSGRTSSTLAALVAPVPNVTMADIRSAFQRVNPRKRKQLARMESPAVSTEPLETRCQAYSQTFLPSPYTNLRIPPGLRPLSNLCKKTRKLALIATIQWL